MSNDIRLTRQEREKYIKMLWFYRKHPVLAARDILGVTLKPHQRIALKAIWKYRNVCLIMSRGMSKTFMIALASLLYTLLYSGMKTLACSGETFRQGQMILEEAESIASCTNSNVRKLFFARRACGKYEAGSWRVLNRRQDSWVIESHKSGSTFKTYPMSNPDSIRGYRAHKIFMDERNFISKDLIQRVILPFANVKRNVLGIEEDNASVVENSYVHAGTIEYSWQDFARYVKDILKRPDNNSCVIEFNYEDAAFGYGIAWEKIERERDSGDYDFDTWAAENKNQLKEDSQTYFGSKLVMSDSASTIVKYKPQEKKLKCYMGIDPAREQDCFSVTILQDDPQTKFLSPIYQNKWVKTRFSVVVDEIFKLLDKYNVVAIGLDAGGGGAHVRDLFLEPSKKEFDPIYDPEDEESIKMLGQRAHSSRNILQVLKPNQERNTRWNSTMKGLLQAGRLKFTNMHFVPRLQDETEERVLKCMVESKKQLTTIKTKAQLNTNYFSFFTEYKFKDLYSSLLYAVAVWKEYNEKELKRDNIYEELGVGGWM